MYMALAAYSQYSFCSRLLLEPIPERPAHFTIVLCYCHSVSSADTLPVQYSTQSRTCRDSVETYSVEMGDSSFMRDGWAVLQPTLTAQPSRSTQRTGPAVLLFLPALRALDFWDRFW